MRKLEGDVGVVSAYNIWVMAVSFDSFQDV